MPFDVQELLDELCLRLGYCIPPVEQRRLVADPPSTVEAFHDAVLRAEGMDPHFYESQDVRDVVQRYFDGE